MANTGTLKTSTTLIAAHSTGVFDLRAFWKALRNGLLTVLVIALLVILFKQVLKPLIAAGQVEENLTDVLGDVLLLLLPYLAYVACGAAMRSLAHKRAMLAVSGAVAAVVIIYGVVSAGQYYLSIGPFLASPSLQMTLSQSPDNSGIIVESVVPGGAAEQAGIQAGDIITGIRRDPIDLAGLETLVATSLVDDPIRLRFLRDGEEMQETVAISVAANTNINSIITNAVVALIVAVVAIFWPGNWTPYLLLTFSLVPLLAGYTWLLIATFSTRTHGLLPVDAAGNIGGFTLQNWDFLINPPVSNLSVLLVTLNTFVIAVSMTVLILIVSAMAGYALSRMNFKGRRTFLSFTLILHGFPAVTLLISIFFVLNFIGKIPVIGDFFGYNTLGGITLVMVAFELPLGIWLMKGFFDNISWDMERSALIDGASRWRTFWEIILPQIRPGLLALGIFAFISGWNAYLIPQTYSVG
ncbi:MAG: ABC transporter permease subunit, partial [Burkholderiales bacterium]|nr:ABC transporter permease subunit [Anaerolineae bacterium]